MKKVVALTIMIMVLVTSVAVYSAEKSVSGNNSAGGAAETEVSGSAKDTGRSIYCFFGLDTENKGGRGESDAIMLIDLDHDKKEIKLASVSRDTILDINGEKRRCNSAYAEGGPSLAVKMLESNLELDTDGYVASDYLPAIKIIDLLGGVEIDVTEDDARHANANIPEMNARYDREAEKISEGKQTLNGIQAIACARNLYNRGWDPRAMEIQQEILTQAFEKLKKADSETKSAIEEIFITELYTDLGQNEIGNRLANIGEYKITDEAVFPEYRKETVSEGKKSVLPDDLEKNVKWLHDYLG